MPLPAMSAARRARIGGALYLLCIASGFWAQAFVRDRLLDYRDAAGTAAHIVASPVLFRLGMLADMVSFISGLLVGLVLYELLRAVSPAVARVALAFAIISNGVSMAGAAFAYAPLLLLERGAYAQAFAPPQLQALALLGTHLHHFTFVLNLGLFSFDCFATGWLIWRSTFLPRALGALLALGGLCYLVNSVLWMTPGGTPAGLMPWIYLPSLVGELGLAVWLAVRGVDEARWQAMARLGSA
jgi:hypothetical protein